MSVEVETAPPLASALDVDMKGPAIMDNNNNDNCNVYGRSVDQRPDTTAVSRDCDESAFVEYDHGNNENEDDIEEGDDDDAHDEIFGQRSESDSELDSPDDFTIIDSLKIANSVFKDGTIPPESDNSHERSNPISNQESQPEGGESEEKLAPAPQSDLKESSNPNASTTDSNKENLPTTFDTATTAALRQVAAVNVETSRPTSPSSDSSDSNSQPSKSTPTIPPPAPANFPVLEPSTLADKMEDGDVSTQAHLMDGIQDIGLSSLSRLKGLDKADPTVRRLFVRPRVTAREVMTLKIDPDIKTVVDEFLKNNIVANFPIARVLRENYAVFYSWLATHLQSERNAWAVRLRQALTQAETERKESIETADLVVESAVRLRLLVQTASNTMFGVPERSYRGSHHVRGKTIRSISQRRQVPTTTKSVISSSSGVSSVTHKGNNGGSHPSRDLLHDVKTAAYPYSVDLNESKTSTAYQNRKSNFQNRLMAMSRLNERSLAQANKLTQSSLNVVSVVDTSRTGKSTESDPGTKGDESDVSCKDDTASVDGFRAKVKEHRHVANGKHGAASFSKFKKKTSNPLEYNDEEYKALYANCGGDLDEVVVDYDDDTDWKKVMRDSIEVLTDICDTLVNDRTECLRLVGMRPNNVASLVEAVSSFIKDRHSSGHSKRKEIERRLNMLEAENKNLLNEMTVLQNTLKEKNNDAMNLQRQLDKVERMLKDSVSSKMNKCVGTDDFLSVKGGQKAGQRSRKSPAIEDKSSKTPFSYASVLKVPVGENGEVDLKLESKQILRTGPTPQASSQGVTPRENPKGPEKEKPVNLTEPDSTMRPTREPSLIEISEEKLKTLKQRARKLEDSLHDAISSMERLNKVTPQEDTSSVLSSTSSSTFASMLVKPSRAYQPRHHHWKKASFEVNGVVATPSLKLPESSRTPKPTTVVKRPGFLSERRCKSEHPPSMSVATEKSSFLEGKSLQVPLDGRTSHRTPAPHDLSQNSRIASSLRVSSEMHNDVTPIGVTPISRVSHVDYTSGEENYFSEDNFDSDTPRKKKHISGSSSEKWASNSNSKRKQRVISRFRHTGRGMVAKCLRCQKLFSSVDNHKLACCYHVKDKERVEHYDQSGRLIRVMYAWKCCRQPQEADGCCYGQHV